MNTLTKTFGFYGKKHVVSPPFSEWKEIEDDEAQARYSMGLPLLGNSWGSFTSNRLPNSTHYVDGWVYIGIVEQGKAVPVSEKRNGTMLTYYDHSGDFETGFYSDASGHTYLTWDGNVIDIASSQCTWYKPVEEGYLEHE